MKVAHRQPVNSWFAIPVSDPVEPWYEAEVQECTERAEREYLAAEQRLARAVQRHEAAIQHDQAKSAKRLKKKQLRQLEEQVIERCEELAFHRSLMVPDSVSADKQVRSRTGTDDHLELGIVIPPVRVRKQQARIKRPTALYRIWDAEILLYIGVSYDFGRRWKQHAESQPWWGPDSRFRLTVDEWFDYRDEAETAEAAAIKTEWPKYNKVHQVKP